MRMAAGETRAIMSDMREEKSKDLACSIFC